MGKRTKSGERRLRIGLVLASALLSLSPGTTAVAADAPEIIRIRHFTAPEHTRIVLDLTGAAAYEVRRVSSPDRLAINIPQGRFQKTGAVDVADGLVGGIRCNPGARRAQVVVDMERRAEFRTFALPAAAGRPDRIVIDVLRGTGDPSEAPAGPAAAATVPARRPFTVVIDPGHGGLDPGAIRGPVREKDVVLEIAREMARRLDELPGYRAVLTRDGDYGLELWERVALARRAEGDLFLSIHANTHRRESVAGMEIYFLSLQGATDGEARELADKENAAVLVGLDPAAGRDDLVMDILMDLRMTQVVRESGRLAETLLSVADGSGVVAGRKVKQAGFQVLKSLAMPSALIEAAYLSNGGDRDRLQDAGFRQQLAAVLVEGVLRWRRDLTAIARLGGDTSPSWTRRYQVRRGDSLWQLARRHGTTVTEISQHNQLASRAIRVGQVLRLPDIGRQP